MTEIKMTENETVDILLKYLEESGYLILSFCHGQVRGNDIEASRDGIKLIIEVKGARADDNSPTKKREKFSAGQVKRHLGAALIKTLEQKNLHPDAKFGIARPDDPFLRKHTEELIPHLKTLGITHYWVSANGKVIED